MPEGPDDCVPQGVTDFIFDLYDSVSTSQIAEEQSRLYRTTLHELSQKYFTSTPWPSANSSIARECNGDSLFLAVYREMTHRHWHNVSRPTLSDRIEGWDVYRELFEVILEMSEPSFFLIPDWVFAILHEFVYQYQSFCQTRTAVFLAAKKQGILDSEGNPTGADVSSKHALLMDNLQVLQANKDAWEVEAVFSYLNRLIELGTKTQNPTPVATYFCVFGSVVLSRLECLLGDYTACLQALDTISEIEDRVIPKDEKPTVAQVLASVVEARVTIAYHSGTAYLQLRRYKDAGVVLADCAGLLQRGFKTGALRQQYEQFSKMYDRMLSLIAVLQQVCPGLPSAEEGILRAAYEKHGSKIEAATSYEDWFQAPRFIVADPAVGPISRQQVEIFNQITKPVANGKTLRSYLKLYSTLSVQKLASFHDLEPNDFVPFLLSYKSNMRQLERTGSSYSEGTYKSALDMHYYIDNETVHVDEPEIQRRFETYFVNQIAQCAEIRREARAINTII